MIRIVFIIEGAAQVTYNWPAVPRVGDYVKLNPFGGMRLVEVEEVVYWNGPEGDCRADVACIYVTQ